MFIIWTKFVIECIIKVDKSKIVVQIMNRINSFLENLGLNNEEITIYLALIEKGPLTILELSRDTGINRTRVYRLLEKLKRKGIIDEVIEEHKTLAKACEIENLELLIKDKEAKTKYLRETFPHISDMLSGKRVLSQPNTKVLFYRGKEGIRQQVWNTLHAKKEAIGYSYRPLVDLIGNYYLQWREEWIKRNLIFRDLYSDEYLKGRKKGVYDNISSPAKNFRSLYISPEILDINHQVDIYNNVLSFYNWHEGEIFGVEIYNEKIAQTQKQLFEIVWKMARPVKS